MKKRLLPYVLVAVAWFSRALEPKRVAFGDNVAITPGAGTTIATDTIGGVDYPRVKVSLGADGSARDMVGKCTPYSLISAATNNSTLVASGQRYLHYIIASNLNATVRYLKLYDKGTAPTIGTDTPKMRIALKPSSDPIVIHFSEPVDFTLGLGFGIVTGITDADNTAVAASEQLINLGYN